MTMTTREKNKWDERHFRICLALLSRPAIPDGFGFTKPLVFQDVINKADRMIALLQQREANHAAKDEICETKESTKSK